MFGLLRIRYDRLVKLSIKLMENSFQSLKIATLDRPQPYDNLPTHTKTPSNLKLDD
jgi:hypothetical protein